MLSFRPRTEVPAGVLGTSHNADYAMPEIPETCYTRCYFQTENAVLV